MGGRSLEFAGTVPLFIVVSRSTEGPPQIASINGRGCVYTSRAEAERERDALRARGSYAHVICDDQLQGNIIRAWDKAQYPRDGGGSAR